MLVHLYDLLPGVSCPPYKCIEFAKCRLIIDLFNSSEFVFRWSGVCKMQMYFCDLLVLPGVSCLLNA